MIMRREWKSFLFNEVQIWGRNCLHDGIRCEVSMSSINWEKKVLRSLNFPSLDEAKPEWNFYEWKSHMVVTRSKEKIESEKLFERENFLSQVQKRKKLFFGFIFSRLLPFIRLCWIKNNSMWLSRALKAVPCETFSYSSSIWQFRNVENEANLTC